MKKWYSILITVINVILYLVIVALWISIPDELTLNLAVTIFNLCLTMLLLFLNKDDLSVYYKSHHFKKLTETITFFVLLFGIMGLINYWAFKHPVQADLSVIKLNSLSDQTKNVLKQMDDDITFKMFARKTESMAWMTLLEFYRMEKSSIKLEKIDIDVRPDLVGDYQISEAATLVVEYKGKRQKVTQRDELNITNALIKISRPADPVIYFITGHDEADLESTENEGLKFIFEAAKNSAIDLRPINLVTTQEIPFDAKAAILWGPKKSLQTAEIDVLKRYLDRKGNLLIGLDPDLNGDNHQNLRALLEQYKMKVRNDLVVDNKSFVTGSNGSIPLISEFNTDAGVTKNFKGQVFFPLTASLESLPDELYPQVKGTVTSLFSTTPFPASWGETSIKEVVAQQITFTPGKDQPGPLSLGLTYESADNRIVVFGNSTFVINAYLKFGSNFALFLNSLSWIAGEDRLISFNLPIVQSEPVFISDPQKGIIFYFSVLFSPLILFGTAIVMYRRKRDK